VTDRFVQNGRQFRERRCDGFDPTVADEIDRRFANAREPNHRLDRVADERLLSGVELGGGCKPEQGRLLLVSCGDPGLNTVSPEAEGPLWQPFVEKG
jgi:hypothetical protein